MVERETESLREKGLHTVVSRREVLKAGIKGAAVLASVMPLPAFAAEGENEKELMHIDIDDSTNFNAASIERLIDENKLARELTMEELRETVRCVQHTMFSASGGTTFQKKMTETFSGYSDKIRVVVIDLDELVQPGVGGVFGHSKDTNIPSTAYVDESLWQSKLIATLLHELSHSFTGTGEARTTYITTILGLHMLAEQKIANVERVAGDIKVLPLFQIDVRELFLSRTVKQITETRGINKHDLLYVILPIFALANFRADRLAGMPHEPFNILFHLSNKDQEWIDIFSADVSRSGDVEKYLRTLVDNGLKECVYLMKQFNPLVKLPSQYQLFDAD